MSTFIDVLLHFQYSVILTLGFHNSKDYRKVLIHATEMWLLELCTPGYSK